MIATTLIFFPLILVWPIEVLAYIGPGMGVGVIATVIGFIVAIFLGLFAFIYYPIKRMIKRRKKEHVQTTKDKTPKTEESPPEN